MISKIFAVDSREHFTDKIIDQYIINYGNDLHKGKIQIDEFADGEISINFKETVRGLKVYLVSSTNSTANIMKLALAVDAARRASASEIIAIIPYYGYARQDRKDGMRGSIGARVFADMIQSVGVNRIVTIDFHAEQIQGFFSIPVDHVRGKYIFPQYISDLHLSNLTLCSPDAGGVKRVDAIHKRLQEQGIDCNMVILSKRRDKPNSIESMELIGDVEGRNVIIIDDIVDTAGTLCQASNKIMEAGATSVRSLCTHPVLSGSAAQRIEASAIEQLIVSDSLDFPEHEKIVSIPCAKPLARLINAINNNKSANILEEHNE